jgi:hypothetical protein
MSYTYRISIPIRSHLKKMIAYYRDVEPFKLTIGKDHYASMIYLSLSRGSFPLTQSNGERFNDWLEVEINSSISTENRFTVDPKRVSYIDSQLRDIFDEKLMEYLNDNCQQKGDVQFFCMQFLKRFGITEEEITLDAMVKSYQRFRHRKGIMDEKTFRAKVTMHRAAETVSENQLILFSNVH